MFYYLLVGSSDELKETLGITKPDDFRYLSQVRVASFRCVTFLCYYVVTRKRVVLKSLPSNVEVECD